MDQLTDGQTLLEGYDDASKNQWCLKNHVAYFLGGDSIKWDAIKHLLSLLTIFFFQLEYYKHLNMRIRLIAEKIHIWIRKIAEKFTFEYIRSQKNSEFNTNSILNLDVRNIVQIHGLQKLFVVGREIWIFHYVILVELMKISVYCLSRAFVPECGSHAWGFTSHMTDLPKDSFGCDLI